MTEAKKAERARVIASIVELERELENLRARARELGTRGEGQNGADAVVTSFARDQVLI